MKFDTLPKSILVAAVALSSAPAAAHVGHGQDQGLVGGLIHPFTGPDHLAAMVMVGLWAAVLPTGHRWGGPATFVAAMILGFGLAQAGTGLAAEVVIAASLICLPVLIVVARRAPLLPQFGCVALFGLAHGYAHGQESGPTIGYFFVGMLVATSVLHLIGLWAGGLIVRRYQGASG